MKDPDWLADLARYPRRPWLKEQSIWAIALYRFGRRLDRRKPGLRKSILTKLYWPVFRLVETFTGVSLPKGAEIGPGLRVYHFGNIFVHDDAVIGANCTLRQGVTIGNRGDDGAVPVLEDDVDLGAYAQVLGGVRVGRGAKVGAMSVVIDDVPAGALAVGNPARLIRASEAAARESSAMTRIALVGCGYVADFYLNTLGNHPGLEVSGVFDRDPERLRRFCGFYELPARDSLDALLADDRATIVVNLTNPREHYAVSRRALEAGKHVYSEKPLAFRWDEAKALVDLAESRGLQVASAPCSVLGEAAQTLWKAIRDDLVGTVRLVYAELDDGMVPAMNHAGWVSESGTPWPSKDEFEVGCTLEHAGYYVTWLATIFGPAESVTSFAACLLPNKSPSEALDPPDTPDFTVACIQFRSGVVARLTCGIVAPHDHSLKVVGDRGILSMDKCWDYGAAVYHRPRSRMVERAEKYHLAGSPIRLGSRRVPPVRKATFQYRCRGANRMDFCRGIAELADAVGQGRPSRLSSRFSLHVNEIVLAIQSPGEMGSPRSLETTFDPVEPMPWASGKGAS